MDIRMLLFLFVVTSFWCCNARDLTSAGSNEAVSVQQSCNKVSRGEAQHMEEAMNNNTLCLLCEEFSAQAVNYLSENKTQAEIISILHKTCTRIPTFGKQCIALVDYYAPLFFMEVSSIGADGFCLKFCLCKVAVSMPLHLSKNNKCDCHNVVSEALSMLEDPNTKLELVELLLTACNSMRKNSDESDGCSRLYP